MKILKLITCIAITAILSFAGLLAQQQTPLPPKNVVAAIEQTNAGLAVKLTWTRNEEGPMPNIFLIYLTFADNDKLQMIGKVRNEPNMIDFNFIFNNFMPGTYNFFVTSAIEMNGQLIESEKSEIVSVTIKSDKKIIIVSKPKMEVKPGEQFIYEVQAQSEIDCPISFQLLEHPEGMTIEGNIIRWLPEKPGDFKVGVKAFFTECNEQGEDIQYFGLRVGEGNTDKMFVKIILPELIQLKLGQTFTQKLQYETNGNCPVNFEFMSQLPEGFEFNKEQPMFRFTPTKEGKYGFTLRAFLDCKPDIQDIRQFQIVVGEGQPEPPKFCANIKGTINYDDQTPVIEGMVNAWKLDRDKNKDMPYFKAPIQQGQYTINVPEGNYALDISGPGFSAEWYEDAEFVTDAQRIEVACNSEININAIVTKLPEPVLHTVSGRVFDAITNEPVLAMVEFTPVDKIFEGGKNNTDHKFVARTLEDGSYSIQLPDDHTFIAMAVSAMNSKQYMPLYYENAPTPMEADMLELTGDLTDINFGLKKVQEIEAGFSGLVKNKDGQPLQAKVIAYCIKVYYNYFKDVRTTYTTETDELGNFSFQRLIPGDYVLMSIPYNKDYVPGYYKQDDFAVLKWKEATIIGVDENMIEMVFEIKHRTRGELGLAKVGGKIFEGGGVIKSGDKIQGGTAVAGAFVTITDGFGNICDYGFTNSEGQFDLDEVAVGTQKLIADKVGFESYETYVETDFTEKANQQVEFSMEQAMVDVPEGESNIFGAKIYPAPADKSLALRFESPEQTRAEIILYNSLGEVVHELNIDAIKGENLKNINVAVFASGAYFMRINIDGISITMPVSIAH